MPCQQIWTGYFNIDDWTQWSQSAAS